MGTTRRWWRWLLWAVPGVVGLLLFAWAGLYIHTERSLRGDDLPEVAALPPGDAVEGARLARIYGCTGCHGEGLQGRVFIEIPNVARVIAPNLTTAQGRYDKHAFLRLMRAGTKADGKLAIAMPNKAHQRMTDQELADLWAHLGSLPVVRDDPGQTHLGTLARVGMVMGEYDVESMRADPPESAAVLAERMQAEEGRRLLQVACGECHGMDLAGDSAEGVPPLLVIKGYSHEHLLRLMREGKTMAGVDTATGFMSSVARHRFRVLTDEEVRRMKDYIDRH